MAAVHRPVGRGNREGRLDGPPPSRPGRLLAAEVRGAGVANIKPLLERAWRLALCAAIVLVVSWALAPAVAAAHPGRTASDGCHYCRTNCARWGEVADQRHCHGAPAPRVDPPDRVLPAVPAGSPPPDPPGWWDRYGFWTVAGAVGIGLWLRSGSTSKPTRTPPSTSTGPRSRPTADPEPSHSQTTSTTRSGPLQCSCGGRFVPRKGPYGKFLGCSRYPRCRNTRSLPKT